MSPQNNEVLFLVGFLAILAVFLTSCLFLIQFETGRKFPIIDIFIGAIACAFIIAIAIMIVIV